jgi:hypothetical protein
MTVIKQGGHEDWSYKVGKIHAKNILDMPFSCQHLLFFGCGSAYSVVYFGVATLVYLVRFSGLCLF